MRAVFLLTVQQLSGRWRIIIMAVLALLPALFTALVVRDSTAPNIVEFEVVVLSTMLAGTIAPLIIVSIASVAFGNEVDDRTLANLTLSPLPRWKIVLPKLGGAVAVALPFIAGSAFLTAFWAFNRDPLAVFAVTVGVIGGLLAYASAFVWLGLVAKQAIGVGLLYIVLWEGFFSGYVSGIRFFSIRHYTTALIHGIDPRRFIEGRHVPFGVAVAVLAGMVALFLWLSVRRLRRMDVP